MANTSAWKELKKQLRPLQGKAIFELERCNSMNDGKFLRVLHQVKPHELVFFDGTHTTSLGIPQEKESSVELIENGFNYLNCKFTLLQVAGE